MQTGSFFDTSHDLLITKKERLGLPWSHPHRLAPTTPHAYTSDCHSRCRPPRAVGHHRRAQQTRSGVQGCSRGGGVVAANPAEAHCGFVRVFLLRAECARVACA
jgi:hypothetical protein